MSGDCTLQSILDDGESNEEDESCVTIVDDQTFCINLVAFLISQTYWINLLVCNYSKLMRFILYLFNFLDLLDLCYLFLGLVEFILFLCLAGDFSYDFVDL